MFACPSCGEAVPPRGRFCPACGGPVASVGAASETRKHVTVLFSDVVGSTELGGSADPEAVRGVLGSYFDRIRAVVEEHGGTVEKFIGDAAMAVFGIPRAHEDDALRAVRAAAAIRAELAGLNATLESQWGRRVELRTGINTGEVVTGDPASGHTLVTGDAVNVAARLEQAASPGEILLGATTYALVADAVDATIAGPLTVKGKAEPVAAWRLVAVDPLAPAHVRRLDAALVGRDLERSLLQLATDRVQRGSLCHLVTVLGPAGIGKTRLVTETTGALPDGWLVLTGRCLPYGQAITYRPVSEIVRCAVGARDDDPPATTRARLAALVGPQDHADAIVDHLAQLLGVGERPAPVEELPWAVRHLLEALAERQPVVVVIDDLQWAEQALLDLIDHVVDGIRDVPLLVVAVARSEFLEERPGWGGGKLNATTLSLEALPDTDVARLVAGLLPGGPVDPSVEAAIVSHAGGNPLFAEELVRSLIDGGVVRYEQGCWQAATADLGALGAPTSVHALLTARLDRLDPVEREVVGAASVVGEDFDPAAVAALVPGGVADQLDGVLDRLVRSDVVRRGDGAGGPRYRFRHVGLRDTAYDCLPKQRRSELHERLADWIEREPPARLATHRDELVGWHLELAWRYRRELSALEPAGRALAERAAHTLATAGRRAVRRGDLPATVSLLQRAVSLLTPDDPARVGLLPDLASALREAGDFAAAERAVDDAAAGAAALGDRALQATVALARLWLLQATDLERWAAETPTVVADAIDVFESLGDHGGLARAWHVAAELHWVSCHVADSEAAQRRAVEHGRLAGDPAEETPAAGALVAASVYGPTPVVEGVRLCEDILARFGDDPTVEIRACRTRACLAAMAGDVALARRDATRYRELAFDLGRRYDVATSGELDGYVERMAGDPSAAVVALRTSIAELEGMGDEAYLPTVAAALADVLVEQGELDEAQRYVYLSRRTVSAVDRYTEILWRTAEARLLHARGELAASEQLARAALALVETTDVLNLHGDVLLLLARIVRAGGDDSGATDLGERALALYERKGNRTAAARAAAVLLGWASDRSHAEL